MQSLKLRRIVTSLFLLLFARASFADVTFVDVYSSKDVTGAASTLTLAGVNCGAGALCKFTLVWRQNAGQTANTPTYGGSSTGVTAISPTIPMGGNSNSCVDGGCVKTWYACGLTGTQSVVFSLSAAGNTFGSVLVYSGVDCAGTPVGTSVQSDSQADGMAQNNAGPTSVTAPAGSMSSDSLFVRDDVIASNTPGAGQTQRASQSDPGSISMWVSDEVVGASMSWTWTGDLNYVHVVTPILAGTSGGGGGGGTVTFISSLSAKDVSGASTTLTLASINAGAGDLVKFNLVWRQNAGQTASTPTYGGSTTGITLITPNIEVGGNADGCVDGGCARTWYACGLTGTQNVVFTVSAAANTFGAVHVYDDVDCAGTPVGTSEQSDSQALGMAGSSVSTNIASGSAGQMGSDVVYIRDSVMATPTSGQTARENESDSGSIQINTSDEQNSTNMGWSWTGDLNFVHIATPINPGAGGGGGGGGGCKSGMLLLKVGGSGC